jgi:hypothetical protein
MALDSELAGRLCNNQIHVCVFGVFFLLCLYAVVAYCPCILCAPSYEHNILFLSLV